LLVRCILFAIMLFVLNACNLAPDYKRPETEKVTEFKAQKNWKIAQPKELEEKGKWWELFQDQELNKLAENIEISNQNIAAAKSSYEKALGLSDQAFSEFFPNVNINAEAGRNKQLGTIRNNYKTSLLANWELDLWGKINNEYKANKANAQASEADLAAIKLSAQADLTNNYLSLRIADEKKRLLEQTVAGYEKSLKLTQNLYNSGIGTKTDLLQASTQLNSAKAELIDIGITRVKLENAIAVLIGKSPSNFTLQAANNPIIIPEIPNIMPSELLERRPDIAAAERRIIAANANIGVAKAAYFPSISLAPSFGFNSNSLSDLTSTPNHIWSLGAIISDNIFDAGFKKAQNKIAKAEYEKLVANYRQIVLTSFAEVEDNLTSLHLLQQEAEIQQNAVLDSEKSSSIFLNQYKEGLVSYLSVVTAQNTEFNNKIKQLNILQQRLNATTNLIKALGGGWH
jgi:NodT family efflux transporter outer membrane factor (OMF) lipoprotein